LTFRLFEPDEGMKMTVRVTVFARGRKASPRNWLYGAVCGNAAGF
jgi:hypothetical protein